MSTTDYINAMLLSLIGDYRLVETWWNTANQAFDYACPCDVDEKLIINYLEGHCFG